MQGLGFKARFAFLAASCLMSLHFWEQALLGFPLPAYWIGVPQTSHSVGLGAGGLPCVPICLHSFEQYLRGLRVTSGQGWLQITHKLMPLFYYGFEQTF